MYQFIDPPWKRCVVSQPVNMMPNTLARWPGFGADSDMTSLKGILHIANAIVDPLFFNCLGLVVSEFPISLCTKSKQIRIGMTGYDFRNSITTVLGPAR